MPDAPPYLVGVINLRGKIVPVVDLALDALAELGNMIAGNAVGSMNDLGFDLIVMPPCVTLHGEQRGRAQGGGGDAYPACGPMSINLVLAHD